MKQFSIKKISKNIYKIEEMWFKEHANLYLFKGKKFNLLFDCGLGLLNLKEFLAKKGFKNVKVILTHSHFDHAGGVKHFLPKEIIITKNIYKNLNDKKLLGLEYLKKKDFSREVLSKFTFSYIQKIYDDYNMKLIKKPIDNIKEINNGSFCFEIINLSGHTDDSTGYHEKKMKILITGDALYNGKLYFNLSNSNKDDFKLSLKKISGLDFNLVLPGHNKIFNKSKALKIINNWFDVLKF